VCTEAEGELRTATLLTLIAIVGFTALALLNAVMAALRRDSPSTTQRRIVLAGSFGFAAAGAALASHGSPALAVPAFLLALVGIASWLYGVYRESLHNTTM